MPRSIWPLPVIVLSGVFRTSACVFITPLLTANWPTKQFDRHHGLPLLVLVGKQHGEDFAKVEADPLDDQGVDLTAVHDQRQLAIGGGRELSHGFAVRLELDPGAKGARTRPSPPCCRQS